MNIEQRLEFINTLPLLNQKPFDLFYRSMKHPHLHTITMAQMDL